MVKKVLLTVLAVLLVGLVFVFLFRNILIKTAMEAGVERVTGVGLKIETVDAGITRNSFGISGMRLLNPKGFAEETMAVIPEVLINYDLGSFFFGSPRFELIRLNLEELMVVRNEQGELNLNSLKPVSKPEETPREQPEGAGPQVSIGLLELKVGKVTYKDYSGGREKPSVRVYNVNINERFENIDNPTELAKVIVARALMKTALGDLKGLNLESLEKGISQELRRTTEGRLEGAEKEAQKALKGATDELKKLLPFGGNEE